MIINFKIIIKFILAPLLFFLIISMAAGLDIATFVGNYDDFGSRANFSSDGLLAYPNTIESIIQFIKLLAKSNEGLIGSGALIFFLKLIKIFIPLLFSLLLLMSPLRSQTIKIATIILIGNFFHLLFRWTIQPRNAD